jgi:hypothetical protein
MGTPRAQVVKGIEGMGRQFALWVLKWVIVIQLIYWVRTHDTAIRSLMLSKKQGLMEGVPQTYVLFVKGTPSIA